MSSSRLPRSIKSTRQILRGSNHILQSLYAQSRVLLDIEAIVKAHLEADVWVASFKNNELTLATPTSALAAKLRYRQRAVIAALQRAGLELNAIKIKVLPAYEPFREAHKEHHLTNHNAIQLRQTAQYIEDEGLRKALIRLSYRASPDPD